MVVGLTEEMNYLKVYQAMSYLYHTDLLFVSTNKDPNFPGANGKVAESFVLFLFSLKL